MKWNHKFRPSPEQWVYCFPNLFPYGDGVFGLPRRAPLTFQQCAAMHLLREELSYRVEPGMPEAAAAWLDAEGDVATAGIVRPAFRQRWGHVIARSAPTPVGPSRRLDSRAGARTASSDAATTKLGGAWSRSARREDTCCARDSTSGWSASAEPPQR